MSSESPASPAEPTERADEHPIPELVDWLFGALFVLVGLATALAGAAFLAAIDRSGIREAVADEEIQTDVLSDPELVDVAQATLTWIATGMLVTSAALVLGGIAYVLRRRRTHRRAAAGEAVRHTGGNAVLGAVATVVTSFVPFSQVLGGFAAGALERGGDRRSLSVGALSGVLSVAPLLVLLAFALGGTAVGLVGVGEGALALAVVAGALLTLGILVTVCGGLGALGGFLGGKLVESESGNEVEETASGE